MLLYKFSEIFNKTAIICWGAFLTGSLFLFGFGKIIALLNDIKNK